MPKANQMQIAGLAPNLAKRLRDLGSLRVDGGFAVDRDGVPGVLLIVGDSVRLISDGADETIPRTAIAETIRISSTTVQFVLADGPSEVAFRSATLREMFVRSFGLMERVAPPRPEERVAPDIPRGNRGRSYRMVDELAKTRKYSLPLSGERFAFFSFWGTEDWEDYASLALTAMQLETSLDLDHRVERLGERVAGIEKHLARIVELLEERLPTPRNQPSESVREST